MGTFPEKERKKRDERGVFKLKEKGESCSLIEDSFSFFFFHLLEIPLIFKWKHSQSEGKKERRKISV